MSAVLQLYGNQKPNETLLEILQRRATASHWKYLRDKHYGARWNRWGKLRQGYVYLIYFGTENIYKIGFAQNVEKRMASFNATISPFEMKLEHTIKTDDVYVIESSFHQYFADKWMRGEWFRLNPDDLALVKSMKEIIIHDPEATADINFSVA